MLENDYQLGQVTFSKNVFWSVNCTLLFLSNLLLPNFNFIYNFCGGWDFK